MQRRRLRDIIPFASPIIALVAEVRRRRASVSEYRVELTQPRLGLERSVDVFATPLGDDGTQETSAQIFVIKTDDPWSPKVSDIADTTRDETYDCDIGVSKDALKTTMRVPCGDGRLRRTQRARIFLNQGPLQAQSQLRQIVVWTPSETEEFVEHLMHHSPNPIAMTGKSTQTIRNNMLKKVMTGLENEYRALLTKEKALVEHHAQPTRQPSEPAVEVPVVVVQ